MKTPKFKVLLDEKYRGCAIRPLAYSKNRQEVLVQVDFLLAFVIIISVEFCFLWFI